MNTTRRSSQVLSEGEMDNRDSLSDLHFAIVRYMMLERMKKRAIQDLKGQLNDTEITTIMGSLI
jgi:hypothetical protein